MRIRNKHSCFGARWRGLVVPMSVVMVFISFVKRGSDAFQDRQGVRQNAPMMKWPPRLHLDNSSLLFFISTITVPCSCAVLRDAHKVFDEML
ncbi:unnamed protein product [Camellia sinensis]